MPFTPNRAFKQHPRIVNAAKGCWLTTEDDQQVLDATAGLWCVNAGHGRQEIADAVHQQIMNLDFSSTFNFGHDIGFAYAERLATFAPDGMDHIFFGNSGSEAVDTALKIAMQYWQVQGKGEKKRFISRQKGFHGVNFGGVSVAGITNNFKNFGQWLMVDHMRHTLDLERNSFSRGLPAEGADMAEELAELIAFHGADTIAAVIVEPIAGAGGVILPPEGYLQRLREICTEHDVLLIFDEVITGWGRTGSAFAAIEFGVTPDLITSAKGITNATIPLSAVFVSNPIFETCMEMAPDGVEFFHGYTYSCHPVACAAGMAALDIYEEEGLLTRAKTDGPLGSYFENALHSLANLPQVIDVRNYGLVGAVELKPVDGKPGSLGPKALTQAWEKGVMIRGIGDAICMSPPLIINEQEIDKIVQTLQEIIPALYAD
jgi:beta-alanine--pyruvate transaminase